MNDHCKFDIFVQHKFSEIEEILRNYGERLSVIETIQKNAIKNKNHLWQLTHYREAILFLLGVLAGLGSAVVALAYNFAR